MADFKSDGSHGFLAEVEQLLNDALGHPEGTMAFKEICDRYGGIEYYIPTSTEIYTAWRNGQIKAKFNGNNYIELADEFGISERWVRELIKGK